MDDSLSPHTLTTQPTSRGFAKTGRAFSVPANISVAPYKLNERRQVNKLRQDSQLIDFEITVSPAEQSVSILCSTGSYSLVAVPVFAQTYVGSTQQVGDISIYCYDITGKVDTSGASVTAVIFYRFTRISDRSSAGGVTIHLHHTARKVQIQGSTMVTKQCRACVWFLEKYLLGVFENVAASKALDISKFNRAVSKVVTSHSEKLDSLEKCEGCNAAFIGRSVRDQCSICSKFFHKKCKQSENHLCSIPPSSSSIPNNRAHPPATSSFPAFQVPVTTGSSPSLNQALPDPSTNEATPVASTMMGEASSQPGQVLSDTNPIPPQRDSDSLSISAELVDPPIIAAITTENTILNPEVPPFIPNPPINNHSKGKAKNKTGVATNKDDIALEFARIEVNTIRARLKTLETRNKDLEFQNSILLERVAELEKVEKEAINEKYFPKPSVSVPTQRDANHHHHLPMPHCPQIQCCSQVHRLCCPSPNCKSQTSSSSDDSIAEVLKRIAGVEAAVAKLQYKIVSAQVTATATPTKVEESATTTLNTTNNTRDIVFEVEQTDCDSVTSIEEMEPGLPSDDSNDMPLNCLVPTIQLQ